MLWLSACSNSVIQPTEPRQDILFFAGYEAYAWGYHAQGFLVRVNGEVSGYDRQWPQSPEYIHEPSVDSEYTEAELLARFPEVRPIVGQLDAQEIAQASALIDSAASGTLSPKTWTGVMDIGYSRFMAFQYTDSTELYRPILLGLFGESLQTNSAAGAETLWRWLASVGDSLGLHMPNPDDPWIRGGQSSTSP